MRKLSAFSLRIKGAQNITPKHAKTHTRTYTHTHTHTHTQSKTKQKKSNLTTGYTLSDVNTEYTTKHDIALMTSTSRVPYPLGIIIKRCHIKTLHIQHSKCGRRNVTHEKNTKQ